MHPRLIQDDMREFGEPVFDVLNPAAADDVFAAAYRQVSRMSSR